MGAEGDGPEGGPVEVDESAAETVSSAPMTPRPPLDPDSETTRITARLTTRELAFVDEQRGRRSRSAYVRDLIAREATPTTTTAPTPGRRLRARQAGTSHRHTYEESGETRPYVRGRLTKQERRQVCTGCPAERWVRDA